MGQDFMKMSKETNAPEEVWIPTYGTDQLFDEWDNEPIGDDSIRYICADLHEARIAELEADNAHFDEAWRLASLRANRHYKRIAELEATNRNHVKAGQLHEQRIAELEAESKHLRELIAETYSYVWSDIEAADENLLELIREELPK